jgi:hypothetical protein
MVKFELDEYHRNITDGELLEDLQRIATTMGKDSLGGKEYLIEGKYSLSTFKDRFGTWNKSLERAGLKIGIKRNISDEELLVNIESVWRHLGRQPRQGEIRTPLSKFAAETYKKLFGTWRKALEAFILYINQPAKGDVIFDEELGNVESTLIQPTKRLSRHINWRTRFLVMRRDDFKCGYCGRSPANNPGLELHIDHVQAYSKDGPSTMDNLRTACNVCNIGKSNLAASN